MNRWNLVIRARTQSGVTNLMLDQTADERVTSDWRDSRWLAIVEVVLVALIFVADARHLIPFSKTPLIFALGWVSLRLRRLRWRDVGLARYGSLARTLLLGLAFGVGLELIFAGKFPGM